MKALKVFVVGIPEGYGPHDLKACFEKRGHKITVPSLTNITDFVGKSKSKSKGHCVIEVLDIGTYADVLNGCPIELAGKPLSCRPFLEQSVVLKAKKYRNARRVFIRNLPESCSQATLKYALEQEFGVVACIEPSSEIDDRGLTQEYSVIFENDTDARKAGQKGMVDVEGDLATIVPYTATRTKHSTEIFQDYQALSPVNFPHRGQSSHHLRSSAKIGLVGSSTRLYAGALKRDRSDPGFSCYNQKTAELKPFSRSRTRTKPSASQKLKRAAFICELVQTTHALKPTAKIYHTIREEDISNVLKATPQSSVLGQGYRINFFKV